MSYLYRIIPSLSLSLVFFGCKKEEITSYEVPREDISAGQFSMPAARPSSSPEVPTGAPPEGDMAVAVSEGQQAEGRFGLPGIPRSWHEDDNPNSRLASYHVHGPRNGEATVSVIGFPADSGSNEDFAKFETDALKIAPVAGDYITLGRNDVYWLDVASEEALISGTLRKGVLSAVLRAGGGVLMVRMEGDKPTIDAERDNFRRFVGGIVFEPPAASRVPSASASIPPANLPPSANNMAGQTLPQGSLSHAATPEWTVPSQWQPGIESSMRRGSFTVPAEGGLALDISVQVFPGDVGGLLANVNRWRRQIGLNNVSQGELASIVEQKAVGNLSNGTWTYLKGASEDTVVAIVMHDSNSWFFKMTGHKQLVDQELKRFEEFVASVRFE